MAAGNRAELLKQLYETLKKQASAAIPAERTVLEHFIFGTCLEDAGFDAAQTAFTALKESLSGWNEVRVSSSTELMEMMPRLPDPRGAAIRVKKILNAVFEERYVFNLDDLRKMNLTAAFTKLESIPGGTPFSTAYTAQVALGRHGIPVGTGEKKLLFVLGIIDEEDMEKREVAGLNRAITKQQGMEFMALLHAVAADFVLNPQARKMISFMKSFAPDYKTRLEPRREVKEENLQETPPLPEVRGSRQYSKKELAEYWKQEIRQENASLDPVSEEVPADGVPAESGSAAAEPEKSGRSRKRKRGGGKAVAEAPAAVPPPAPAVKEKKPAAAEQKPVQKPVAKPAVKPVPKKKPVSAPAAAAAKKSAPKAPPTAAPRKPVKKPAPVAAKKPAVAKKPAAKKPVAAKKAPVKKAPEKKPAGKLPPVRKGTEKKPAVKKLTKTPVKAATKNPAAKAPVKKPPVAAKKAPVKKPAKPAPKASPKPAVKHAPAPKPVKGKPAKKAPAKKPSSKK